MKSTILSLPVLLVVALIAVSCAYLDPVRPQAVYEATATARAQLASLPPVTIEPDVVPGEEVGETLPDPTPAPPCTIVKGNIASTGEKIFHVPGQANYNNVKIDEAAGEAFFCSEGEAVHAGFRKALR